MHRHREKKGIRVKVALLLLAAVLGGVQGGNGAKISRKAALGDEG
jgi:hypothetical protein